MKWMNEPPQSNHDGDSLYVRSAGKTDFWRITHDGGIRDHGHFYNDQIRGDFDARVEIIGQYQDQYDQAGMMVRVDPSNWLKCGIEMKDGVQYASAVVTRGWSDWSVVALQNPASIWIEVQRRKSTFEVLFSLDGKQFQLMRQAHLAAPEAVEVGPMIAAPTGSGFEAEFRGLQIAPPNDA